MRRAAVAVGLCALAIGCGGDRAPAGAGSGSASPPAAFDRPARPPIDPPPPRSPLAEADPALVEAPVDPVSEELANLDTVLLTIDVTLHSLRLDGPGPAARPTDLPVWMTGQMFEDADVALAALGRSPDRELARAAADYRAALASEGPRLRAQLQGRGAGRPWPGDAITLVTNRGRALRDASAVRASSRPTAPGDPGTVVAACGAVDAIAARMPVPSDAPADRGFIHEVTGAGLDCLAACDALVHVDATGRSFEVAQWGLEIASGLLADAERLRAQPSFSSHLGNAAQEATYMVRAARKPR